MALGCCRAPTLPGFIRPLAAKRPQNGPGAETDEANPYLVNISRRPVVDEAALVDALQHRTIAGTSLDTYEVDPLPLEHPFLRLRNTLLTPHLGYVTEESCRAPCGGVVEDIRAFLSRERVRAVNPQVLKSPQLWGLG